MGMLNFNIISVLLLGARVAAAAGAISLSYEHKAWLMLSWVSTVAGNLSLLGTAANLMVCEQARRAPHLTYNLSFGKHLKFGVPSTLIVTAVGLTLIHSSSTYVRTYPPRHWFVWTTFRIWEKHSEKVTVTWIIWKVAFWRSSFCWKFSNVFIFFPK